MCQQMLGWARSVTAGSQAADLLELYCGNANFTIPLATNFRCAGLSVCHDEMELELDFAESRPAGAVLRDCQLHDSPGRQLQVRPDIL